MRQWDIVDYPFQHPIGIHPAVILSPDEVASNPDSIRVNVLVVTTVRAGYQPGRYDVMLNGADGLDHLSRVRVSPIFEVDRSDLGRKRGSLSTTRQKIVAQKIRQVYRLD
jgi:mRNA-degrading endonuclease toxin of MazEF toxin-antitoxin module